MKTKSLILIKPLAFRNKKLSYVINKLEENDFEILAIKLLHLTKKMAREFYSIHKEKPFFDELINFMTSDKIVAICVAKKNCVNELRELVGNTNPSKADKDTIRANIGTSITANGVHASDSDENASKEIRFFFSALEII